VTMTSRPIETAARVSLGGRSWALDMGIGGALLVIAGAVILMGIITAEAVYPATYSTAANAISDLGGTEPPNSVVLQPSASIFDASMVVTGLLVLVGSWFVHRAFRRRSVTVPIAILGAAALGVGLFPGDTGTPHGLFAMATFISGGVAAITSARVTSAPFRYVSLALGVVPLATLLLYMAFGEGGPMGALGLGGIERWIVYPIVLWVTGFGGYLAGRAGEAPSDAIAVRG
jgi:hypothetical membrane protein